MDQPAQAAEFLTSGLGTTKERLVVGGKMLRTATMFTEEWPPDWPTKANRNLAALLAGGTLERTVREMGETAASKHLTQLTEDVTELANQIEQARSQKRPARQ